MPEFSPSLETSFRAINHHLERKTQSRLDWPRLCQHLATFTSTKLGAEQAQAWQPASSLLASQQLLAQTEDAYKLCTYYLRELDFSQIKNIHSGLDRAAHQGVLTPAELLEIAQTQAGSRNLRRVVDSYADLSALQALLADLRTFPQLEQEIHRCITEQGEVSERASPQLGAIRQHQQQIRGQIHQQLQQLIHRKHTALQDTVITQRAERYVLPVKAPQRDAVPGIVHDVSTSGATLYIEPQTTVELNNRLRQLARQAEQEEYRIREILSQQVTEVVLELQQGLDMITQLDLAVARARYGLWLNGNIPRFVQLDEPIHLRNLRHPLLIWQQQQEQGATVVPITIDIAPPIKVVTITGPNTGGKTATLKTLGLVALMAKAGLMIPAAEPVELPWFRQVLADIGDEQSLQQNLSTFSGHIRTISQILQALGEQSHLNHAALVLLDEVGAGTDPSEGTALAIALLTHLADQAQLTIATTHYGELKALKYQDARFENASVEFDPETLAPTYRLLWGIPGRSNALAIAQRLGLNPDVIATATQALPADQDQVNQVIAGLEAQRRQQEAKASTASQLLAATEKLHQELLTKTEQLRQREQHLRQHQEQTIAQAIAQAQAEIAQLIKKLQAGPQTAQAAAQAQSQLKTIQAEYTPPPPEPVPGYLPQIGERVRIPKLQQTGEIIGLEDDAIAVRLGLMKVTVKLTDIESLTGEKPQPPAKITAPPPANPVRAEKAQETIPTLQTERNTLDIRGQRVASAEILLDEALNHGGSVLWVIHGHGTGKLRQFVHEHLRHHPLVEKFEFAPQNEGGRGATIVYFRQF
ncbi:endonuclease MutS2 [Thermosynechococcaceae cyanobacterium BACA0444]|uniref:Endonuclease MutS2 n=1 Tax=Pseudocalidococcus azoricus BACA0444 TaxID=2918990 RepID=A0AAE4FQZ0_9CYAN|nr:endonuclease MutS2 [Pseudocalidococcus azoricus]MDS3860566.1 endonuclease MutS2 [Pseudocalidococcus azoricus BACA0444]